MYYGGGGSHPTEVRQDISEDLRKRVITLVLEIKSNVNLLRQIVELNEVHAMILKNNGISQHIPSKVEGSN